MEKFHSFAVSSLHPASILYKSIAGRYRPVRVADVSITARYRFIKNAYWGIAKLVHLLSFISPFIEKCLFSSYANSCQ